MKNAVPPIGRPISPSSMHWRAVWWAPPRNVSGAQPTPQALGRGGFDQRPRLGDRDAERLFRMDVLARGDRLEAHLDMRLRHGEVENDLDRRIGENRLDRARRNPEFGRARLGRLGIGVGERDDVEDRELFGGVQIGGADVAAADDADADRLS